MARPSKYTPETVGTLTRAISAGAPYELACKFAGVHYDTFNTWRKTKAEFSEAIEKAEGRAVMRWLDQIDVAAKDGAWTAAAWKLERRYPQLFGRRPVLDPPGNVAPPSTVVPPGPVDVDALPGRLNGAPVEARSNGQS